MKIILIAVYILSWIVSGANAGTCKQKVKAIDDALETEKISFANRAMLGLLRSKGKQLHEAGLHNESEKALKRALLNAKKILSAIADSEGSSGGIGSY